MSFTQKILEGWSSLLEKIGVDDEPLPGVAPEEIARELEARAALREKEGVKAPENDPVARVAGAGEAARSEREKRAVEREKRVRGARRQREEAARRAQDEAFRRMADEARRQGARPSSGGRGASGSRRTTGGNPFSGLGRDKEIEKHYKTLDLSYGAELSEVKASYRRLMRKYHPDLHNQSPKKQKAATELSMQVTAAYNALEKHLKEK